ncbi:MAG: ABC transporter permease [Bryobacteraceae bacterium]
MKTVIPDLQFAARMLLKSPGFAAAAILSLALGIGANTAIFSLIDAVLLRMLPVSHAEQLMFVNTNAVQAGSVRVSLTISNAALRQMQQRAKTIAGVASDSRQEKLNVGVNGQAELAAGNFVSGNYFSVLGVPAILGRTFGSDEDRPDGRLAIVSFAYWQTRFGGDPGVIGRAITVNSVPFTIIGVTPREFYGISADVPAQIMMPASTRPQVQESRLSSAFPKPTDGAGDVIARVKPGIATRDISNELSGIFRQAALDNAGSDPQELASIQGTWIELTPASQGFASARLRFSEPLKVLMAVVAIVMLIACANVANLLLVKASARQREIAIRLSLGSNRGRLVRQLLTESLLLAVLGGVLGIVFAMWARDAIIYFAGARAGAIPTGWNLRVLGFTAAICLANALLFGIVPALRATGIDFAEALKSGRSGRHAGRLPLARVLVAAQISLSLTLLVGAALFLETFRNLDRVDLGYDRDHSLLVTLDPMLAGYKDAATKQLYQQILERVGGLSGVRSVSLMESRLMKGEVMLNSISVPGYTLQKGEDPRKLWVISNKVGPRFFAISGMHLASGRDFTERDNAGAPKVVVINQSMARHFFGDKDPVGQRIGLRQNDSLTVAGVIRDVKIFGMREGSQDVMFTPFLQAESLGSATLMVRTTVDPVRVAGDVRAAIRGIDAKLPQFDVMTMDKQVENTLSEQRLLALLAGAFGLLALGLAAIGLYGVLSYGVAQRTSEIGIRMALGAQRIGIQKLILGETARLVLIGIAIGIAAEMAAGRAIKGMFYGVTPTDGWSIGAAVAILAAAALIAGFLPARRASQVDPMVALRHE